MRSEPILGAQQKLLEGRNSIVNLPVKLSLQERVEALPELGRGEDGVLGCLLWCARGGDGECTEIEGDLRVAGRVGRVGG